MILAFTSYDFRRLSRFNHTGNKDYGDPEPPKWKTLLLALGFMVLVVVVIIGIDWLIGS